MCALVRILFALHYEFEARAAREAEILVLRQQLLVLSRKSSKAGPLAEQHGSIL